MKSKKIICAVLTAAMSCSLVSIAYAQEVNTQVSNASGSGSSSTYSSSSNSGIITSGATTVASTKISKDAAKNIAKEVLKDYFDTDIDETKYQTNVSLRPSFGMGTSSNNPAWQIDCYLHTEEEDVNIAVVIDANTGKLLNIYNMVNLRKQNSEAAVLSQDEAKNVAENFLKKINPNEFSSSRLISNDDENNGYGDPTVYNFNYCRVVNGLPFIGNNLSVGVDSVTGKIRSYSFAWNDNAVPAQDGAISQDKADALFRDNLKFYLKYITCRDPYGYGYVTGNPTLKLVYMMDASNGVSIDAKEGNLLGYPNTDSGDKKVKDLNEEEKQSFLGSYKPLEKPSKELDSSSAEAIMKQIVNDVYGEDYDIQSTNYQDSSNGYGTMTSCWSGQFVKKDSNGFDQGQITIDSSTGQLVSINKFNPMMPGAGDDNSEPKLTWEQAYDKAVNVIEKYFPDRVKDINTEQTYTKNMTYFNNVPEVDRLYNFNFSRLINGIAYQDNSISVNFDSKTGEIDNLYNNWSKDLKVPAADGIIGEDDAKDIFYKKYTPELGYTLINTSKDLKNPVMEVKLAYSLLGGLQYRPLNNIDAFTGKFVDYNGQEVDDNAAGFKEKIKDSPAEKELSVLASQGIIDTKNFDLNKQLTRADLIKMLVNAKGYRTYSNGSPELNISYGGVKGDEMYKYLQSAVMDGILDNSGSFNGDETVTREEMVKDIVKLLGYDDIAKARDIFTLSYSDAADITPDNLGYAAVAKGLGITNDTDNKFRPKDPVTMEDAAVVIYKALGRIRSSQY